MPASKLKGGQKQGERTAESETSMATSLLSPLSSAVSPSTVDAHDVGSAGGGLKSYFLQCTKLFSAPKPERSAVRRGFRAPSPKASFDNIPKQFRQENLKDGLMENYKNVPQYFYGLTDSQMDMFMTEDNPISRQAERVTEESISSARCYLDNGGMWSLSGKQDSSLSRYSMSVSMYRGGRGTGRPKSAPPDLPSLLLDARICYLGMPIVPAVAELLVAQFMWLDFDNPSKPIYLYINSTGTVNEKMETVGSESEAYAIADSMSYCKSDVYTVNCGVAYGQAAMLLSVGAKGHRGLQPNASTKLYLPKVNRSSGATIDMWIKAKELDANSEYYIELLAKGTGKTKEEIRKDVQRPKYLQAQEAIDYGLADKIISSMDPAYEKRNYDEMKAMRKAAAIGPRSAPSGFR